VIYREYLVMRRAVAWFAVVLIVLICIAVVTKSVSMDSPAVDFAAITQGSGWLAATFAAIFGVALGNASREAARVVWVLPASRWKLAIQIAGVDLLAIAAAYACAFAILLLSLLAAVHFNVRSVKGTGAGDVIMALAMAYAAYGWSALIGVIGRRVGYCGIIALPALMIWMFFAPALVRSGGFLRASLFANPFVVFNAALALKSTTWETPVLIVIAVATCAAAVALWQRAEVIY
jgi:hypothetical protein